MKMDPSTLQHLSHELEEFDGEAMHRKPVMIYAPLWYSRDWPKANVAMGYWDKWLGGGEWNITMFESCSAYAWVTYNSKDFAAKIKFFAEIEEIELPC